MPVQGLRYPTDRMPRAVSELSEVEAGTGKAKSSIQGRNAGTKPENEEAYLAEDDGALK